MIYKKKDFAGCQFNPLTDQPMLEAYSTLNEIIKPEYMEEPELDKIIRYVIMVYDPKCALVLNERDINYRKGMAAELAGFDVENVEYLTALYASQFPYVTEMIFHYLRRFGKSKEWAATCAYEFAIWESIRMIMEPVTGKSSKEELEAVQKKAALKDELDKDIKRLDSYFKQFFGDDNDLIDRARKRMTPEMLAEKR